MTGNPTMDTWLLALAGGAILGGTSALLMYFGGRVLGISGILGGLLNRRDSDTPWRSAFLVGLLAGGAVMFALLPEAFANGLTRSVPALAAAGLLVGFGARIGSGCTSGHGICGVGRFSARSIAATATFMATGAAAAFVVNHLLGGAL